MQYYEEEDLFDLCRPVNDDCGRDFFELENVPGLQISNHETSLMSEFHSSGDSYHTSSVSHQAEGDGMQNSIHQESNWVAQYDSFFPEDENQTNRLSNISAEMSMYDGFKPSPNFIEITQNVIPEDQLVMQNQQRQLNNQMASMYYPIFSNPVMMQNFFLPANQDSYENFIRTPNLQFKANSSDQVYMQLAKDMKHLVKQEPTLDDPIDPIGILNEDSCTVIEKFSSLGRNDDSVDSPGDKSDHNDRNRNLNRSKQKRKLPRKLQARGGRPSKGAYNNPIEHDFLERNIFKRASFEVRVKPARRLNTEYASIFPSEMCSKPYKYLLAIRSEKKSHFKIFLTIQQEKESDEYTQLSPVEHSSASGVHVQRIKQKEARNGDDIQYFYIKFLETSFKNKKKMFRLNVVDDDKQRFESNPVKLVARRSKRDNQDIFWSNNERPPTRTKSRKSRMELDEEESLNVPLGTDDEFEDDPDADWSPLDEAESPIYEKRKRQFDDDLPDRKRRAWSQVKNEYYK